MSATRHAFVNAPVLSTAMAIVLAYSAAVVYFYESFPPYHVGPMKEILGFVTLAIGLVFGFRVNTAYDRWWEGRKLWGQLVNETRNLATKYSTYFESPNDRTEEFARLLSAFPFSLKYHLRGMQYQLPWASLPPAPAGITHVPLYLSKVIYERISQSKAKATDQGFAQLLLDPHAKALMDICGACERIKLSPISGWFTVSIWLYLCAYLISLPWLLAPHLDWWSIPTTLFVAYLGFSLELLSEEIQEPFGCDPNDLPTDKICHNIARSLEQVFGVSLEHEDPSDCQQIKGRRG